MIRPEQAEDLNSIRRVHESAFPTAAEARLVETLRANGKAVVSLVAEVDGRVVAHILFSPATIEGNSRACAGLGLAPVAVLPEFQNRGVGSQLIRAGLDRCRQIGCGFVIVLGHPSYYLRFGFRRASEYGLTNEYAVDDPFMAIELAPGALPPEGGLARYAPEFAEMGE